MTRFHPLVRVGSMHIRKDNLNTKLPKLACVFVQLHSNTGEMFLLFHTSELIINMGVWQCHVQYHGSATEVWQCHESDMIQCATATVLWECHGSVAVPCECHGSVAMPQCQGSAMQVWQCHSAVGVWQCTICAIGVWQCNSAMGVWPLDVRPL